MASTRSSVHPPSGIVARAPLALVVFGLSSRYPVPGHGGRGDRRLPPRKCRLLPSRLQQLYAARRAIIGASNRQMELTVRHTRTWVVQSVRLSAKLVDS